MKLDTKESYREWVKAAIASMSESMRSIYSAAACANIAGMEEFKKARTLLAYRPIRGECSPDPLVAYAREEGKRVAFPLCINDNRLALYLAGGNSDFVRGRYGILEPDPEKCERIDIADIDLAVIPGVAFDASCNRMGRGAGYYDRLLAGYSGTKVGLAYQKQIFASIPSGKNDVPMDYVATNNGIIVKNHL